MNETANLPTRREFDPAGDTSSLPISVRLISDDAVYQRVWSVAQAMARSPGLVPQHLNGKPEACFIIVVMSLERKLSPIMVARSTYQTPGGGVGFMGKLARAVAESSGYLDRPIKYEFYGDWSKVEGKFVIAEKTSSKTGETVKYARATWRDQDEEGLGVRVIMHLKNEVEPRTFDFDLRRAHPRNSVIWATDPKTQLMYTATRRAIDAEAPHLLMGLPFEDDVSPRVGPERAKDVTPPSMPDPLLQQLGIAGRSVSAAGDGAADSSETEMPAPQDSGSLSAASAFGVAPIDQELFGE